jgi:hypothetical protein
MHRTSSLLAILAALSFTAPAFADAGGPYNLDAKGKCHDAKGGFVAASKCKAPAAAKETSAKSTSKHKSKSAETASNMTASNGTAGAMGAGGAMASNTTSSKTTSKSAGGHPVCKTGKPCGDSCIAKDKVCHK